MQRTDSRYLLLAVILFAFFFPRLQSATETADDKIRILKKRLAEAHDLIEHRDVYLAWQKKMEQNHESLWGSGESGDFLADVQRAAQQAGVPIQDIRPLDSSKSRESLGAELQLQGDMNSIGRFIYEVLNLPGFVAVEKMSLTPPDSQDSNLLAELLITRKIHNVKKSDLKR